MRVQAELHDRGALENVWVGAVVYTPIVSLKGSPLERVAQQSSVLKFVIGDVWGSGI